ncbi:hypothetical protein TREMEDRAFT_57824, partial [Tremella mesenterica DSM 1558]
MSSDQPKTTSQDEILSFPFPTNADLSLPGPSQFNTTLPSDPFSMHGLPPTISAEFDSNPIDMDSPSMSFLNNMNFGDNPDQGSGTGFNMNQYEMPSPNSFFPFGFSGGQSGTGNHLQVGQGGVGNNFQVGQSGIPNSFGQNQNGYPYGQNNTGIPFGDGTGFIPQTGRTPGDTYGYGQNLNWDTPGNPIGRGVDVGAGFTSGTGGINEGGGGSTGFTP